MVTFPNDIHFSNVKLKKSFDKRILTGLDRLDKKYSQLEKEKNNLKNKMEHSSSKYLKTRESYPKKIQNLFDHYTISLKVFNPSSKSRIAKKKIIRNRGRNLPKLTTA